VNDDYYIARSDTSSDSSAVSRALYLSGLAALQLSRLAVVDAGRKE